MICFQKNILALLLIPGLSPVPALHGQTALPVRAVGAAPQAIGAAPLPMAGGAIGFLQSPACRPLSLSPNFQTGPVIGATPLVRMDTQLRPELRTELDAKMRGMAAALGSTKAESSEGTDAIQKGAQTPSLQPIDIKGSIEASGIAPHVEEIRKHSKGVMTAYDFLSMMGKLHSGYILGVAGAQDTFNVFSEMSGLKPWSVSYREFGIPWSEPEHTRIFMENITRTERPIVFLVPNEYSTHPRAKLTRDEMDWLLAAPQERMKNVYFVFGAYDLISDADYAAHYKSKEYSQRKEAQIAALKALQKSRPFPSPRLN